VTAVQNDNAPFRPPGQVNLTNGLSFQPAHELHHNKDFFRNGLSAFVYTGGQNLTLTGALTSPELQCHVFKSGLAI